MPIRVLEESEHEDYVRCSRVLAEFEKYLHVFGMVDANEHEYHQEMRKLSEGWAAQPWFPLLGNDVAFQAGRRLANFLTAMRLFLDQTDHRLSSKFGENSSERNQFLQACTSAFDSTFAYRFLYRLRNYVQHRGLPIGRVNFYVQIEGASHPPGDSELRLFFDAKQLLGDYQKWGPVKEDLQRNERFFPVDGLLPQMTEELRKLKILATSFEYRELRDAGACVVEILRDAISVGGIPAVGTAEYSETEDVTTYDVTWPPLQMLRYLKLLPDSVSTTPFR